MELDDCLRSHISKNFWSFTAYNHCSRQIISCISWRQKHPCEHTCIQQTPPYLETEYYWMEKYIPPAKFCIESHIYSMKDFLLVKFDIYSQIPAPFFYK